jgi:hypothetical protein
VKTIYSGRIVFKKDQHSPIQELGSLGPKNKTHPKKNLGWEKKLL